MATKTDTTPWQAAAKVPAPKATPEGQSRTDSGEALSNQVGTTFPATQPPPAKSPAETPAQQHTDWAQAHPTQNSINEILNPYIHEMLQLGPEYGAEMEYLKPYLLQTGAQTPETFQQLQAGSKADESATGSKAVNAADQAVGEAIAGEKGPGFGNLAKAGQQFENTVPYQQPLIAALSYQKYLETYGGQQTPTKTWDSLAAEAYKAVLGTSATSSGLPGINSATAATAANNLLTPPSTQGGGSTG